MKQGPRSRQVFFGDDWWELRDAQVDARADVTARIAGRVGQIYLRAAVVMGRELDPVALALRHDKVFDLRALLVAHDHLAGHWRLMKGHVIQPIPGLSDLGLLLKEWSDWAMAEARAWIFDQPILLRRFALVLAFSQTDDTVLHEMDLWDALKEHYPLTPPAQGDLFDDPASYSPYR